jgi:hypothetical protein
MASIVVELVGAFLGGTAFRAVISRKKRIVITEFKRGVRSSAGREGEVLLPGCYSYNPKKETILDVDMRPQPILVERLICQDALNRKVVISVATELSVLDPVEASTRLKDQINDTVPIVWDTLREVLSKRAADVAGDGLAAVAHDVTQSLNIKLYKLGMKASPVEITEKWVDPNSISGVMPLS